MPSNTVFQEGGQRLSITVHRFSANTGMTFSVRPHRSANSLRMMRWHSMEKDPPLTGEQVYASLHAAHKTKLYKLFI